MKCALILAGGLGLLVAAGSSCGSDAGGGTGDPGGASGTTGAGGAGPGGGGGDDGETAGAAGSGGAAGGSSGAAGVGAGGGAGAGGAGPTTGAGGQAGGAGSGAGGPGGAAGGGFVAVDPCHSAVSYVTGQTAIVFGNIGPGGAPAYDPKCLKVPLNTTVTFSGDFSVHPLAPSPSRGTLGGNPITATTTGTGRRITFANPGFYAYDCTVHGVADGGAGNAMTGVIWVE